LVLAGCQWAVPCDGVSGLPSFALAICEKEKKRAGANRTYNIIMTITILSLKRRLDTFLQIIRRNDPSPILMQPESIILALDLAVQVAKLLIAQLCFAPRVLVAGQVDAQMRIRDEPVVDFTAVHGVFPECEARRVGCLGVFAKVGTSGTAERGDFVLPVRGEDALNGGGRKGGNEAERAQEECECGLHGVGKTEGVGRVLEMLELHARHWCLLLVVLITKCVKS
jgi:hypothetical protein